MSAQKTNNKEEKQFAVSKAILDIIDRDGVLGVTHSKVSRKSGVSRAWVYEYIGKDKNHLIEFATKVFATYFSREKIELPRTRAQLEEQLKEGVSFVFDTISDIPVVIKIYFRFRGSETPMGEIIRKYEEHWLDSATRCAVEILGLPKENARLLSELLLTIRLGFGHRFATSVKPLEARARAEKIFDLIHAYVGEIG